jgi:YebC/PmpR family DNA-binding regulatory protein
MAGHSKWANIQHRKGAQDAKRGKLFTKLIREITIAAKMGDPDPVVNPRLRAAIDKAYANNMTKDSVERAVKRGSGGGEGDDVEEIRYEGYGPGGIAVMVDCMTNNRNRTVAEVRHAFTKAGGNLGTDGCVAYIFKKSGVISFAVGCKEDTVMEQALEAGAEDIISHTDGSIDVLTDPEQFGSVKDALQQAGLISEQAEVTMLADNYITLQLEDAEKLLTLVERLEDLDDVQAVYTNADIPPAVMQQIG